MNVIVTSLATFTDPMNSEYGFTPKSVWVTGACADSAQLWPRSTTLRSTTCGREVPWISSDPVIRYPSAVSTISDAENRIWGNFLASNDFRAVERATPFARPGQGGHAALALEDLQRVDVDHQLHRYRLIVLPLHGGLPGFHSDGQPMTHLRGPAGDAGQDLELTGRGVERPGRYGHTSTLCGLYATFPPGSPTL